MKVNIILFICIRYASMGWAYVKKEDPWSYAKDTKKGEGLTFTLRRKISPVYLKQPCSCVIKTFGKVKIQFFLKYLVLNHTIFYF